MKIYSPTGTELLDITPDDSSYRYRAIMGENSLTLQFSLVAFIEIPQGAYCTYEEETYTLERPENLKMQNSRNFEYTLQMEGPQAKLALWKFRNPVDGRLKFSLTATPSEHLQMLLDNLNDRDAGWTSGPCIEGEAKTLSYNHNTCAEALTMIAEAWETEYEHTSKQISLHRIEYNRSAPLALSYGKGNGFRPGLGRTNYSDHRAIDRLYIQGGEKNIDLSTYNSSTLLLPKSTTLAYDGEHFEDEEGFNPADAITYATDANGQSVKERNTTNIRAEDSLDCSDIYPRRTGTVSQLLTIDEENHLYDIVDASIPISLDYRSYQLAGQKLSIVFQNGMLAGREFDVNYYHQATGDKPARRFEIVPQDIDGQTMPGGAFLPIAAGDNPSQYIVFGCSMPADYTYGAQNEMLRKAIRHLHLNRQQKFTFSGELDGIWAKNTWETLRQKIIIGGYINFSSAFQPTPVAIRIVGIREFINNPQSPQIELSNENHAGSLRTTLKKIDSNQQYTEHLDTQAKQFTRRRFRDAEETMNMLAAALTDDFTTAINPITVQTMAVLLGDESLQFRFVDSAIEPTKIADAITYAAGTLTTPASILQHMTLGISKISSAHAANEYSYWNMAANAFPLTDHPDKKYYLYAKCATVSNDGVFLLSETPIGMHDIEGYYHLLIGLINSEYEGDRSITRVYGFTEITPGRIAVAQIADPDGNTVFDLAAGTIEGKITFKSGTSGLDKITGWSDVADSLAAADSAKDYIDNTLPTTLSHLQDQVDGVIDSYFYPYAPTVENYPASGWTTEALKAQHIGDTFTNTQEYIDDVTTPNAGKSWRWVEDSGSYLWTPIADSDAVKALLAAATAQDTADHKRRVFVTTPTPPYDIGDLWTGGSTGDLKRCKTKRLTGSYFAGDWELATKYTDDTTATAAASAAAAAQSDATDALESITDIISDSVLSADEKPRQRLAWDTIAAEKPGIEAQATSFGITTEKTAYTSAFSALGTYLNGESGPYSAGVPLWLSDAQLEINTDIVGATYRSTWEAYYDARTALLNAIYAKAKQLADTAQGTANAAASAASALSYLATALTQETEITGGLIATSVILLRNALAQVVGGVSGIEGSQGFWMGGTFQDFLDGLADIYIKESGAKFTGQVIADSGLIGGILHILGNALESKYFKISDENIATKSEVVAAKTATIPAYYNDSEKLTITAANPHIYETAEVEIESDTVLPYVWWGYDYTRPIAYKPGIFNATENSSCRLVLKIEVINNGSVVAQTQQTYDYNYAGGYEYPGAFISNEPALAKGTVKLRLTAEIIYVSYFGAGTSFKIYRLLSGTYVGSRTNIGITHYMKRTEIGGNGFYSFWELTKYLYYSATEGLHFKGFTNLPGVLAAASVASTGAQSNKWGAKVATSAQPVSKTTGVYTVPHNIGHSAYTVQVTCNNSNRYFAWCSSKGNTSVVINIVNSSGSAVDANFDYMIIGEN